MKSLLWALPLFVGLAAVGLAQQLPGKAGPAAPQFAAPKAATTAKPSERAASPEELAFFESKIRPVLVEKCYQCHASGEGNKLKGGLLLDSREGARKGGDTGPAVVPGDLAKSKRLT